VTHHVRQPLMLMMLAAGYCMASAVQAAGSASAPLRDPPRGSVEWVVPPVPSARPQTEDEKVAGRERGRTLPQPEVLQPTLDVALPVYRAATAGKLEGTLEGASSDVLVGLVQRWFERFKAIHPGVTLRIKPPYAGSLGTKELIKESVDFVFVSRELKPEDIAEFRARFGYPPTSIPISGGSYRHYGFLDAIAFFVHPDNPLERLDFDQIDAIFSSTRHRGGAPITTWGQLGLTGDWADRPIRVHAIEPWNGFEEFIRQRVLSVRGKRGEWRNDLHFEKVVFPLAANVASDPYAIGYSGIAYLDAPVKVLPLSVDAAGPAIAPTYENVALERYPLSRLIYFNFNKAPGKPVNRVLDEFLRFVLSREGQQVVREQGIFLPLRAAQVERSRSQLGN
jgi:phosphate transport system substrate-binding protein